MTETQQGQKSARVTLRDGVLKIGIPVGSILTVLFAFAGSYIGDLQSTATASLEIIHQHTRDLQTLTHKLDNLELITKELKVRSDQGDRFTAKQGRALQKRVRDLEKQHIILLRDQNKLFEIIVNQNRTNINLSTQPDSDLN